MSVVGGLPKRKKKRRNTSYKETKLIGCTFCNLLLSLVMNVCNYVGILTASSQFLCQCGSSCSGS